MMCDIDRIVFVCCFVAQLIWMFFWSTVVGYLFQSLCARIGLYMNQDLAQATRTHYKNRQLHWIVWFALLVALLFFGLCCLCCLCFVHSMLH